MKEIAIIGVTASGKSYLALKVAKKTGAIILSLDSLSVYKEIDIASAKPTKDEMQNITHFGIDEVFINESFNVKLFFNLYKKAKKQAEKENVPLIIVGGTSFYLKSMLSGFSDKPLISLENSAKVLSVLEDLQSAYKFLEKKDLTYAQKIEKNDKYRIEKWYELYYQTDEIPTLFLKRTMKKPIIKNISIFEVATDKDTLKQNISIRTKKMIQNGLIDEVAYLEKKYTREPNCMRAIGIKEVIDYFDGFYNLELLEEKIILGTTRLAKKQRTFNRTQFIQHIVKKSLHELEDEIMQCLKISS